MFTIEFQPAAPKKDKPGEFWDACFVMTSRVGMKAYVTRIPIGAVKEIMRIVSNNPQARALIEK